MNTFGGTYSSDGRQMFWKGRLIAGAEPGTFEPLNETWSRDAARVYCQDKRMKADRASFMALSRIYAKDKDHVYDYGSVVTVADAPSFEVLRPEPEPDDEHLCRQYARDHDHVFHKVLTVGKVSLVRGASAASFRAAGHGFGLDREAVYFELSRLSKCDPASWVHLGLGYSRDRRRVYYGNGEIAGADVATFEVLPSGRFGIWARDAHAWYEVGVSADSAKYREGFGQFAIFQGTVVAGEVIDPERKRVDCAETSGSLGCRFTVQCEDVLQGANAHPALLPPDGGKLEFAHFDPLVPTAPARWIGRSRLWFCQLRPERAGHPASLYPAYWRTFWPASRRADVASLLASLGGHPRT